METRVQTVCLVLISTVLTGAALYWLRPVMVPFVMALFITLGLRAGADFLEQRVRVPRSAALATTVFLGLAFLAGIGALVSASVSELSSQGELYNAYLTELVDQVMRLVPPKLRLGQEEALSSIPVASVGGFLGRTANAIAATLSNSLVVLVFVLFLLLGGRRRAAGGMWGEAEKRVKRYLATKALTSLATGLLVGLTLSVLGVPLAAMFGLLAFLLNFIPSVGSIVATLLPLPIVLVSPEISTQVAVAAIAVPTAIQLVFGNFLEPKIMGESLDLHPATILLSLILWGTLWGVLGMILSVPITVVVKILCERFEGSRPVADLLAGRTDALAGGA
jgi:AI-2 transport protein TqsA